jgi:hypothetical protein
MTNFKTLSEAREAYETQELQLANLREVLAKYEALDAELLEAKAFGSRTATENENFRLLIVQKDGEISALKAEKEVLDGQISEFKTQIETLGKEQKTAKTLARELVAASGGVPIAIDQAEISRMQAGDEKDFRDRMLKEQDPAVLNQLYKEYNRLFRPNGQNRK